MFVRADNLGFNRLFIEPCRPFFVDNNIVLSDFVLSLKVIFDHRNQIFKDWTGRENLHKRIYRNAVLIQHQCFFHFNKIHVYPIIVGNQNQFVTRLAPITFPHHTQMMITWYVDDKPVIGRSCQINFHPGVSVF